MSRHLMAGLAFALAMLPARPLLAADVAGIKVPDSARVGNADLLLNGAGVRTRMFFKIYVGALYLGERTTAAESALAAPGPKRIAMFLLRDLTAGQLTGALVNALDDNLDEAEQLRFQAQIAELKATMEAVGAAAKDSVVALDFVPGAGTRISVDGVVRGKVIAGEDFYRALMKIWLGDKPVEKSLKAAMLGQG